MLGPLRLAIFDARIAPVFSIRMNEAPTSRPRLAFAFLAVGLVALSLVLPWHLLGIPSGHDFEFHFNSWVEVVDHWREGIAYPHWVALAHYRYGEARFVFYPPLSWTLGASLGAVLPWVLVPAACVWLALMLAGVSTFVVARRWLSYGQSLFAAALYVANPYHLVIVYWRSAFAELLAAAYLPLLLFYAIRLEEDGERAIAPLSVVLALGWLTNVPSAVMMNYSLGLLALWFAVANRSRKTLGFAAISVLAGAALAAVYLVPVWHQRTWVNLDQVLSPGVRPQDNFLFIHTTDADHDRFNLLISVVASGELILLLIALLWWRAKRLTRLWWPLLLWASLSALLMFSVSAISWRYLPELRYVQLPWRWLLVLNVVLAFAVTIAFRRWSLRLLFCVLALALVLIAGHRILHPWWDSGADLNEMVDNQHEGIGNEGADEYVPAGADPYDIDQNAPLASFKGTGATSVKIHKWASEDRIIDVKSDSSGMLVLRLFSYPLWRATVNGRPVATQTTANTAQLALPLPAGESLVEVKFVEGWDRLVGFVISVIALLTLGSWQVLARRQPKLTVQG